ncbi:surface-adhesin E family protein [Massilia hydrophila]|uniref:surface-adhesin E family protein n=1 Tax=Massilia hydrophila TaxID=3044279 RepID=UPI0034E8E810
MRKFISLLVLISTPVLAVASDWQPVSSGDGSLTFVDFDSISISGAYRKAWIKSDYLEMQETDSYPKKSYQSGKFLYYFDCKKRMVGATHEILYSSLSGSSVASSQSTRFSPNILHDVAPDSWGEAYLNTVCGTASYRAKIKAANKEIYGAEKPYPRRES